MMNTYPDFAVKLQAILANMAKEGIYNAARGMSAMVGETLTVTEPNVRLVPFTDIPALLGGPENEAVGIYLRVEGKIPGQIMLVIPYLKALELADLVMGESPGTTQELGTMERSALAELGNLTASFFLNAVADSTGLNARPSPPAVMVDMVGAIMDIIIATTDILTEQVLMIQAKFLRNGRETQADFWIIPDVQTLEIIAKEVGRKNAG
ncbi:MAG: chemotaxis protein CheC [Chloroflexota bacterium]